MKVNKDNRSWRKLRETGVRDWVNGHYSLDQQDHCVWCLDMCSAPVTPYCYHFLCMFVRLKCWNNDSAGLSDTRVFLLFYIYTDIFHSWITSYNLRLTTFYASINVLTNFGSGMSPCRRFYFIYCIVCLTKNVKQ